MSSLGSGNKDEPDFKMAFSEEERTVGPSDADQFLLFSREKFKQETHSTGISIGDPENESGPSKVFGTDDSSSKGRENDGSSGKRRHSRWDATSQADKQNVDDGVDMTKQRKTRWANNDCQLKMLNPVYLPDFVKGNDGKQSVDDGVDMTKRRKTRWANDDCQLKMLDPMRLSDFVKGKNGADVDPKVRKLKSQLKGVNRKLQYEKSVDEVKKLVNQKHHIVRKLIQKHPAFSKKVYIPVKKYPEYNFVRLILGHRGTIQRRMEKATGARIMLRGKGSTKRKNGKTTQRDEKPDPSDDEDLHVLIEADSQESFDAAVAMVEKKLISMEDGKSLRGKNTYKTDCKCEICGDAGHYSVACPFAGKLLQTKAHENDVNFLAALGGGFSPFTNSPFPGKQPVDVKPAVDSAAFVGDKSNKDVDYTNLYVAHLPWYVDVGRLVQLFSPFGALSYVQVIRDKATGLSEGCGFVKYCDSASAAMALNQMNGYRLDGNMLLVQVAGHQNGTPGSIQPVEHTSVTFPTAFPSTFATTHIHAPTRWPGPPHSMLSETHGLMCTSYGSSYTSPTPSSLTSTLSTTSRELARFPGNPDNFASGYTSLFS